MSAFLRNLYKKSKEKLLRRNFNDSWLSLLDWSMMERTFKKLNMDTQECITDKGYWSLGTGTFKSKKMSDVLQIKTLGELTRIVDGFYLNNSGDELTKKLLDFYDKQWIEVDGLVAHLKELNNGGCYIGPNDSRTDAINYILELLGARKKDE